MFELRGLCGLLLGLVLGGCGGDGAAPADPSAAPGSADPAARARYPLGLACGWQFVSDIDSTNVAFPDESATYWVAQLPRLPGLRLRIDGRYPRARYFSYNVYDPLLRPIDAIADAELVPDAGGRYTAYVDFGARPASPPPNTLYAGEMDGGGQALPTPFTTALIYRIYLPEPGLGADGGAGLPVLTLETADGASELLPFADCDVPLFPNVGGTLPALGINALLLGLEPPEEALGVLSFPTASYPPVTTKFHGLPNTAVRLLGNVLGMDLQAQLGESAYLGSGGGFLSNLHNAYVTTAFARNFGNIFVWRGKAPSWPGDARLAGGAPDMRYWSTCQNEFVTQRFTACVADYQSHLDAEGYFTVVVSDAGDRPANAGTDNAIDWLPWGPFSDGLLIHRHMLPAPPFAHAVQNVDPGDEVDTIMAAYAPVGAYCTRETFEAAGARASDVFAACLEETRARDPGVLLGLIPVP